jgi:hypothetical protein
MVRGNAPKPVGAAGADAIGTEPTGGRVGHEAAGICGATNAEGGNTGPETGTCAIPGGGGTSYWAPEGGGAYGEAGAEGASGRSLDGALGVRRTSCTSGRCGMNGGSNTGRVGNPSCGSGSANVGVRRIELDSIPGSELRSGGSVSPGRLAHSGSDTGPDGGFECWLIGGDGRGTVGGMGACGVDGATGVPGGADDGAGDDGAGEAGTGRPAGGWPATDGGGAGDDGAWAAGCAAGAAGGAVYGCWAAGGAVGTDAAAGACSGASNTSCVHCWPSQRRRRAASAGSGYQPGGITEVPSATLTRILPSVTCRKLVVSLPHGYSSVCQSPNGL